MQTEHLPLRGNHVILEALAHEHADGLAAASAIDASFDPSLYRWSQVPQGKPEVLRYIDVALAWREAGMALSFAIVRAEDNRIIGSTRFFNVERWAWPAGHIHHGRATPDGCEIGYTWLSPSAIRTAANTEAKLLMLEYAFETWKVHRVCLHTDVRNTRSAAAMERIGAKLEGVLRAHRMASDFIPRDSLRFSIIASEWPEAKEKLRQGLVRTPRASGVENDCGGDSSQPRVHDEDRGSGLPASTSGLDSVH